MAKRGKVSTSLESTNVNREFRASGEELDSTEFNWNRQM